MCPVHLAVLSEREVCFAPYDSWDEVRKGPTYVWLCASPPYTAGAQLFAWLLCCHTLCSLALHTLCRLSETLPVPASGSLRPTTHEFLLVGGLTFM